MVFFKRLSRSRSRSNSHSYVDSYADSRHDSKANSATSPTTDADGNPLLPPPSRQSNNAPQLIDHAAAQKQSAENMYARHSQQSQDGAGVGHYHSAPNSATMLNGTAGGVGGGYGNGGGGGGGYDAGTISSRKTEPAPDLLLQAFNQALRPYNDKVENLENEIADLKAYIDQLEGQQRDVHAWIDKRGLRPDVPASIAAQMDAAAQSTSPTHAAATLNAQLDRKITIVNFDLHRLQDDLNDSLPTPSFSACMLKFLPDIARLAALPAGSRFAFDLLLKLGGNLNSHGGLEAGDEADLRERRAFYARLDDAMVTVVRGRFREERDAWGVPREIKRIEKTGAYLRNWGVEPYFPRTLQVMREGSGAAGDGGPDQGGSVGGGAGGGGAVSPPMYS